MSEHITPEVGDVWINKTGTKKYLVICIHNTTASCLVNTGGATNRPLFTFVNSKYLGKSKASIEQLFEVENEE